jgi:hypothetical protein
MSRWLTLIWKEEVWKSRVSAMTNFPPDMITIVLNVNWPDSFTYVVGELVGKLEINSDGTLVGSEVGRPDGCEEGYSVGT